MRCRCISFVSLTQFDRLGVDIPEFEKRNIRAPDLGTPGEVAQFKLFETYKVGEPVVCCVIAKNEAKAKKGRVQKGEKTKGFIQIELSIRPSLINAGLTKEHIIKGMSLPVSLLKTEEEHVVECSLGSVDGVSTAVLKRKNLKTEDIKIGKVMLASVAKMHDQVANLKPENGESSVESSKLLDVAGLRTGMLVKSRVLQLSYEAGPVKEGETKPTKKQDKRVNGGVVKLSGEIKGELAIDYCAGGALAAKQEVVLRILAVLSGSDGKPVFHVTTLPHIVDWEIPEARSATGTPLRASWQADFERGSKLAGTITEVKDSGVMIKPICSTDAVVTAFCPRGFMQLSATQSTADAATIGDKVEGRVLGFNYLERTVVVALAEKLVKEEFLSHHAVAPGQVVRRWREISLHLKYSTFRL